MYFFRRIISSIWNKIASYWRKFDYSSGEDYIRIEVTNCPLLPEPKLGLVPVLQTNPQYSINAQRGRLYRVIDEENLVTVKEYILNKLYLHLIPQGPKSIEHSIEIRKLITNHQKIGVYDFNLTIKYSITDPESFVKDFYQYVGTDSRSNDSTEVGENCYCFQHFRKVFVDMITPLLQQSLSRLISDDNTPNNKDSIDLVERWSRMDPHKNRENNLFGFQLSQIVTEYKKIPPYIEINKCVINKLNYYIDEKNND